MGIGRIRVTHITGDTVGAECTMKESLSFYNHIHKGVLPFFEIFFFEFIGSQDWD
jgi:hypothetical protein